jgi:uncharacterized damage-inducible protein DinB
MDVQDLLIEVYGRVTDHVHQAIDGLDADQLARPPGDGTNSIGWLVWHLTRVEDHHISELIGQPQVWTSGSWAPRIGVEADPHNTGYGHTKAEVEAIRPDGPDALLGYYQAVRDRTETYLRSMTPEQLDQVVDERWDPPVTLGVRLVSIADDEVQHAGQANYVRGLLGL